MQLRKYQQQGKAAIDSTWDEVDIIFFVLATGGGKTVTFTEVIRDFRAAGKRTMLIAHREELITQAQKTLQIQGINSGIVKADYPLRPEFLTQIASVQTLASRLKKLHSLWPELDLIVIDEGHHVQADNTYGKVLQLWPNAKILIVSATPYRLSGKGFTNICPGKEVRLIVNCTIRDLINEGWLVPFEYYVCSIPDLTGVPIVKGEYDEQAAAAEMMLAPIVESYMEHANGMQGICFCVDVAHSKDTAEKYNAAGIPAAHVDGTTPQEQRNRIFGEFKRREILVVCNVGILTEGTDFPVCEFVQLASPTMSLSKFLQELGRGSRVLPGIVDKLETPEQRREAIFNSAKAKCVVLDNVAAFMEHGFPDDEHDWHQYFNGWKRQKAVKPTEEDEMIEMLLFEVEDPQTKDRKLVSDIEETKGMKLVKITKEMRENLKASKHIRQFDKIYAEALQNRNINKPGYYSFYRFIEYCRKNRIEIKDSAWKYIKLKLVEEPRAEEENYLAHARQLGKTVIPAVNVEVGKIRAKGVTPFFYKKEKDAWHTARAADIQSKQVLADDIEPGLG